MAIVVPSRFACLNPVDDDYRPKKNPVEKNNATGEKENKNKKNTNNKAANNKAANNKKNKKIDNVKTSNSSKPQAKKKKDTSVQWEQWKEKDMTYVNEAFEEQLHQALLLSKLDYEEQKQKCPPVHVPNNDSKKTKKKPMSLGKFRDHCTKEANVEEINVTNSNENSQENESNFFKKFEIDVQKELNREQNKKKADSRKNPSNSVTILQFQHELEKLRLENEELKKELEKSRHEITVQKTRNKKLASLIGHGDIKDKAEALLEIERLSREQSELTAEVARLYGLLEQERSKVGALTHDFKHKEKNKKRNNLI